MTMRPWKDVVEEQKEIIFTRMYHPLVDRDIRISQEPVYDIDTALFNFVDNTTTLVEPFLDLLHEKGGLSQEQTVRSLLQHEIGHYVEYPRELATLIYFKYYAEKVEKIAKHKDEILAQWFDLKDNLEMILLEKGGKDIKELYRGFSRILKNQDKQRQYSVQRLMNAFYQEQGREDLGEDLSDAPFLKECLEELLSIDYRNTHNNAGDDRERIHMLDTVHFYRFGEIIAKVLDKEQQEVPQLPHQKPLFYDVIDLKQVPREGIEKALDTFIIRYGKKFYENIREFLRKETGLSLDPKPSDEMGKGIGTEKTQITFYDEEIPYYERLARTYGVYIQRKPVKIPSDESYREGKKDFEIGTPLHRLDPFSAGGRILPGVTKEFMYRRADKRDITYKIPDLLLVVDTSGSRTNPKEKSIPILAEFILARNYWMNGAKVGVLNFSVESALLLPTRDLQKVYHMLCGYHGGGTVLNMRKILQVFYGDKVMKDDLLTEEAYNPLLEQMSVEERRKIFDKSLRVKTPEIQERYEKLDTIISTDGGIANIVELIAYLNATARFTRNTIVLESNSYTRPEQLEKLGLENTTIVPIEKKEDLLHLALKHAKKLASPDHARSAFAL